MLVNSQRIPKFVSQLGHRIVAYVLNISERDAQAVLANQFELDTERTRVFEEYIRACTHVRAKYIEELNPQFGYLHGLSSLLQNGHHIFSLWRKHLGGIDPQIDQSDDLTYQLSQLALDLYPSLLIGSSASNTISDFPIQSMMSLSGSYLHPNRKALLGQLVSDPAIREIFQDIDKQGENAQLSYWSSVGRGSSIPLNMLAENIISKAFELMRLRNHLAQEDHLASVVEVLALFRSLSATNRIVVPAYIGLHNVAFEEPEKLETALGTLHKYHPGFFEYVHRDAQPSSYGNGDERLGVVLETKFNLKVVFDKNYDHEKWNRDCSISHEELNDIERRVSLAFTLGVKRTPPVSAVPAWTLILDPIGTGTSISSRLNSFSPFAYHQIDDKGRESIKGWCLRLANAKKDNLEVAIRRILLSINERLNPLDGFIDAIIAWESLFGGNQGELRFRISASIAMLLSDKQNRLEFQSKVAKLYDDRSRIVHGAKEIELAEAIQKRNDSLDIVLECLRIMYVSRTDLLNAPDRSRSILLQ
jgi:hypothetical protein